MLMSEQHVIAQDRSTVRVITCERHLIAQDHLITMYAVNGQCHGGSVYAWISSKVTGK